MFITDFPKLYEMVGAHPILAQNVRFSQSGLCPTEMGKAFDVIYDRFKRYRTFTDEEEEFFEALQQRLNRWYGKYKPIFDVINSINGYSKSVDWDIDKKNSIKSNTSNLLRGENDNQFEEVYDDTGREITGYNGSEKTVNQSVDKHTLTTEYGNGVNSTVLGEADTALSATDTKVLGSDYSETGYNNRSDETHTDANGKRVNSSSSKNQNLTTGDMTSNSDTTIGQDINTTDTEKTLAMMYKRYGINSFGEELLELVSDLFLGVY